MERVSISMRIFRRSQGDVRGHRANLKHMVSCNSLSSPLTDLHPEGPEVTRFGSNPPQRSHGPNGLLQNLSNETPRIVTENRDAPENKRPHVRSTLRSGAKTSKDLDISDGCESHSQWRSSRLQVTIDADRGEIGRTRRSIHFLPCARRRTLVECRCTDGLSKLSRESPVHRRHM